MTVRGDWACRWKRRQLAQNPTLTSVTTQQKTILFLQELNIEKQSSSRLVLLGLIPLKHKLGWAIVCFIICSLFFLNFCLPRKLENCSNRAIDWLLSNEASQVKTAPISGQPSPLPCPLYFQNHCQSVFGSSTIPSQISKPGSIPGENSSIIVNHHLHQPPVLCVPKTIVNQYWVGSFIIQSLEASQVRTEPIISEPPSPSPLCT